MYPAIFLNLIKVQVIIPIPQSHFMNSGFKLQVITEAPQLLFRFQELTKP